MRNGKLSSLLAFLLIIFLLIPSAKIAHAAAPVIQPVLVNTILTSQFNPPSPDPAGLAYNPNTGTLILCDSEVDEMPNLFAGKNVFVTTLSGQVVDTFTTTTTPLRTFEPAGIAYNPVNNHIFISNDDALRVYEDDPGADGRFNTADDVIRYFSTSAFGNTDPEGITYDSWRNHLILTSGLEEEIFAIDPGPNGIFEGSGDDIITQFDTSSLGLRDPESVEFNDDTGNLFILSALSNKIGEVTPTGEVLRYIDIFGINGYFESGLAYAPGSNNPSEKHLYIVARGTDNNQDPNENDGKLYEISFPLLPSVPTPTRTSTLPVTATSSPLPTATPINTSTASPTLTSTSTMTPTMTLIPSPTIDPALDVLFADGFESGNLSAWTASSTNGGNLAVTTDSALVGSYGLSANISGTTGMYVEYNHPGVESRYRARFYFDINSIAMAGGDTHIFFYGHSSTSTRVLRIELRRSSTGLYQLRPGVWNDSGSWVLSSYITISDAPHIIEFDYQASSGPGANNGYLTFWIDGVQKASLTGVDNDTRLLDFIRLGPQAVYTTTQGIYYLDSYEAHRFSYIGPTVPSLGTPTISVTPLSTSTASPTVTTTFTATHTPTSTSTSTKTSTASPTLTRTATASPTLTSPSTMTPTATFTPTMTVTPSPTIDPALDVLFADGFESGDFSAWTASSTNGGNLAVTTGSALVGSYGLSATISNNPNMYVEHNHPGVESRYRARFYFDLNSITMAKGDAHYIFYGYSSAKLPIVRIELRRSVKTYQLRAGVWNDSGSWVLSNYFDLTDAPHFIEFDYQASSGPGANNGYLTFWIDGLQKASLTGVDNDTRLIDYIRLGPQGGIVSGTSGIYYFDGFEAHRFSYIGSTVP